MMRITRAPRHFKSFKKTGIFLQCIAVFLLWCFFHGSAVYIRISSAAHSATHTTRSEIQQKLIDLGSEIAQLEKEGNSAKSQARSLEREISIFATSVKKLEKELSRTALELESIKGDILNIEEKIKELLTALQHENEVLAEAMRLVDQSDDASTVMLLVSAENLSKFWEGLEALSSIQEELKMRIHNIKTLKQKHEQNLAFLEETRTQHIELLRLQENQKRELALQKRTKESLLGDVRAQQQTLEAALIQSILTQRTLQQQLFLLGVPGGLAIEEAFTKARNATEGAGIRPAFLLAVLQKESQWGARVGKGNWREDMHPRDHAAFLQITKELGLDPDLVPVSAKPSYGWGGAMGPAQFLPTTWLAWKDRISKITGHSPPSPWNIDDAFAAASLKLAAAGADKKTPDAEHRAAMIYFAGGNWQNASFQFYGNAVLVLAELLQIQIERLRG